jgi:hypothetical protein
MGHEFVEAREVVAGQRDRLALRRPLGHRAEQAGERLAPQPEREAVHVGAREVRPSVVRSVVVLD